MMLHDLTIPASSASIVPRLTEWHIPASSAWTIKYRSSDGAFLSSANVSALHISRLHRVNKTCRTGVSSRVGVHPYDEASREPRGLPILTPRMAREHPANRAKLAIPTGS